MGHVSGHPPADGSDLKARIEAERAGRPFLLYKDGHGRQQLFSFDADMTRASVGRDRSSDLVLDWDEQVSRLHAQLERVEEDWTVVDDGLSRNGTFLNGERLSGRRRLTDGDTLSFGGTTVTFRSPRAEEHVDVSSTQRRVLLALSRPYKDGNASAGPAGDAEIAEDVFLSVDEVKTHLSVLCAKFGIEHLPQDQRRIRLVERALYGGVISERDL